MVTENEVWEKKDDSIIKAASFLSCPYVDTNQNEKHPLSKHFL
jgi:hypothetical protein